MEVYDPYWTSWIERKVNGEKEVALVDNVRYKKAFDAIWEKRQEKFRKGYDDSWKVKTVRHDHWDTE